MTRVLIIEDDSWLAQNHASIIHSTGCDTEFASSGDAAMRIIENRLPDIILLDIMLEGGTAFALMHELQTYDDTASIPIIIASNVPNTLLNLSALEQYGVRAVLDKSLMTPRDLIRAVEGVHSSEGLRTD